MQEGGENTRNEDDDDDDDDDDNDHDDDNDGCRGALMYRGERRKKRR